MCGIIAIAGRRPVQERLLDGLAHLEYRGYDSAGIAVHTGNAVVTYKTSGQLERLRDAVNGVAANGLSGIGHTRWATHGRPDQINAHPHRIGEVAVVHNGIIENFCDLRDRLMAQGRTFVSQTDSEVIAHLIDAELEAGLDCEKAFSQGVSKLTGSYAIVAVFDQDPGILHAACSGSPLMAANSGKEVFIASDAHAICGHASEVIWLQDGDLLRAEAGRLTVREATSGHSVTRQAHALAGVSTACDAGSYGHFLNQEIHQQPEAITRTLSQLTDLTRFRVRPPDGLARSFASADRAVAIACGSSLIAAGVARFWFENIAQLSLETAIASEYRYRRPCPPRSGPAVLVSQSGETADTLAALKWCQEASLPTIGVCNVANSSLDRKADIALNTAAGIERSVASTKTFTTQLMVLALMAVTAARARGVLDESAEEHWVSQLATVPRLVAQALTLQSDIAALAQDIAASRHAFFLGRGAMYPMALEGALKLKEVSYIHAEGFAAGELKHGPLALIEPDVPVIAALADDHVLTKTLSSLQEVGARGGRVIVLADGDKVAKAAAPTGARVVTLPAAGEMARPFVAAVAFQFLAYHTALLLGRSIDRPRNLAKSVTVE